MRLGGAGAGFLSVGGGEEGGEEDGLEGGMHGGDVGGLGTFFFSCVVVFAMIFDSFLSLLALLFRCCYCDAACDVVWQVCPLGLYINIVLSVSTVRCADMCQENDRFSRICEHVPMNFPWICLPGQRVIDGECIRMS